MSLRYLLSFIGVLYLSSFSFPVDESPDSTGHLKVTEWVIADLLKLTEGVEIVGEPDIVDSQYGKAVHFDGEDDGIFIDQMPMKGMNEFTIEILVRFESGGGGEQRFFHCGEVQGDRVLLETRADSTDWYLDGFVQSGDMNGAVISPALRHSLDQWYHIAFEVKDGKQLTFINGQKELEGAVEFNPIMAGRTSVGVRQNKISWFKGTIYKIRITNKLLEPSEFF